MNTKSDYPLAVSFGTKNKRSGFTFILSGKKVKVEGADDILPIFLSECNGFHSFKSIFKKFSPDYSINDLKDLATALLSHGIIVDSREQYLLFNKTTSNPMPYHRVFSIDNLAKMLKSRNALVEPLKKSRSPFENLLESRESTRDFSGEKISKNEFLSLAWAMYGKINRKVTFLKNGFNVGTVPSGGALYPLCLYAITLRVESFSKHGVYKLSSSKYSFLKSISKNEFKKLFIENPLPFNIEEVSAIYILSCDFRRTTQKYSNRGYRLALLEAGHSAQNAYLWCAEQGIGIFEIGGFHDKNISTLLNLEYPYQAPLTVLIVGRKRHGK